MGAPLVAEMGNLSTTASPMLVTTCGSPVNALRRQSVLFFSQLAASTDRTVSKQVRALRLAHRSPADCNLSWVDADRSGAAAGRSAVVNASTNASRSSGRTNRRRPTSTVRSFTPLIPRVRQRHSVEGCGRNGSARAAADRLRSCRGGERIDCIWERSRESQCELLRPTIECFPTTQMAVVSAGNNRNRNNATARLALAAARPHLVETFVAHHIEQFLECVVAHSLAEFLSQVFLNRFLSGCVASFDEAKVLFYSLFDQFSAWPRRFFLRFRRLPEQLWVVAQFPLLRLALRRCLWQGRKNPDQPISRPLRRTIELSQRYRGGLSPKWEGPVVPADEAAQRCDASWSTRPDGLQPGCSLPPLDHWSYRIRVCKTAVLFRQPRQLAQRVYCYRVALLQRKRRCLIAAVPTLPRELRADCSHKALGNLAPCAKFACIAHV